MIDPRIAEGVKLVPELQRKAARSKNGQALLETVVNKTDLKTIIAALTAAGEMAGESVLLNDIRTIADSGGRRIETAMDACDNIVELIDMERQLGSDADPELDKIVMRRGGRDPEYDYPCNRPEIITCAQWECQRANQCCAPPQMKERSYDRPHCRRHEAGDANEECGRGGF